VSNDLHAKEIGQLLEEVSEKLPKMFCGLMNTMYSSEAGKKMGRAVGSFYKELIDSGIPSDEALKMAKDYMLLFKEIINHFEQN
jgi:tetrahydromethanopterin S-methyltransferase subunit G